MVMQMIAVLIGWYLVTVTFTSITGKGFVSGQEFVSGHVSFALGPALGLTGQEILVKDWLFAFAQSLLLACHGWRWLR